MLKERPPKFSGAPVLSAKYIRPRQSKGCGYFSLKGRKEAPQIEPSFRLLVFAIDLSQIFRFPFFANSKH